MRGRAFRLTLLPSSILVCERQVGIEYPDHGLNDRGRQGAIRTNLISYGGAVGRLAAPVADWMTPVAPEAAPEIG